MSAPERDADDEPPPAHKRRPRYRGSHPRRFAEKYKELAPERYPDMAGHVRARGGTPAGQHVPIMVAEVMAALAPAPGERGVDCTLGYGGHARAMLAALAPGGRLLGLDVDPIELPKTEGRLAALGHEPGALIVRHGNFAGLAAALEAVGWSGGVDFVFADLGVSSMQVDDPARGFGLKADGPLDMRMDPARGVSAAEWLGRASLAELTATLRDNADEPHARRIAASLVDRVRSGRGAPRTTHELADAIRAALAGAGGGAGDVEPSVRRVFQALRIRVNDELGALSALLAQLPGCLAPGGRAALISFHSGEDRRVKLAFRDGARAGVWAEVCDEVIRASPAEQRDNPRSSSAKLRWARRA